MRAPSRRLLWNRAPPVVEVQQGLPLEERCLRGISESAFNAAGTWSSPPVLELRVCQGWAAVWLRTSGGAVRHGWRRDDRRAALFNPARLAELGARRRRLLNMKR